MGVRKAFVDLRPRETYTDRPVADPGNMELEGGGGGGGGGGVHQWREVHSAARGVWESAVRSPRPPEALQVIFTAFQNHMEFPILFI